MNESSPENLVELIEIAKSYGGVRAIENVSLNIVKGECLGLIGPNGSGKTTLVNIMSGIVPPTSGQLLIRGELRPFRKAHTTFRRYRFARTFQNIRLAGSMTVQENVLVGMHSRFRMLDSVAPWPTAHERAANRRVEAILEEVGIADFRNRAVSQLSYGDQRRVEIARALAADPVLLMLDEPAAGMNPREADRLSELLTQIAVDRTVLLIEHNMSLIMSVADRLAVLDAGKRIALGGRAEVAADPRVREAYLGRRHANVG